MSTTTGSRRITPMGLHWIKVAPQAQENMYWPNCTDFFCLFGLAPTFPFVITVTTIRPNDWAGSSTRKNMHPRPPRRKNVRVFSRLCRGKGNILFSEHMDGLNTSPQLNQLLTVCTRDNYHTRMSVRSEIDLHFLLNLDISRIPSTKEEQRSEIALHSNSTWIFCKSLRISENAMPIMHVFSYGLPEHILQVTLEFSYVSNLDHVFG